ncbi:family 1 glycosylhydrolase [Pannus brasiliensis CCIBt3594]|uniref:dTDP-4-dehydrorhamnose reductase n=1 Tax=Pannus brasiliensis CCIBt3594 TaxID=1427578 RepID=A0AAW9QVZ6_9CHRO
MNDLARKSPLEMWAGIECTVNRVGEDYFDQLTRNGHDRRLEDLEMFAELGIAALRYPLLWERIAPDENGSIDWSWADERLEKLRELNIRPIAGLVHHGSGPRHTSLLDPRFPEKLADYARAVADRYPWLTDYTPVNEPLTTARFSGLYGHWYPHGKDPLTFARALLNQCKAVILAIEAIREVNPTARLIQTEDLGKIYSTPTLSYQADFENERRWLSFDLLMGKVTRDCPMGHYLRYIGISDPELDWFLDRPCPPDILGINHYLTSDRYLDENLDRYPPSTHGGNGKHRYADVEAVRVREDGIAGIRTILREAWERYRLPIAITEAHIHCTREEQTRWLYEVWRESCQAREEGIEVRAITAWALLGSFDWNSLVTRSNGHYEVGVFDLRSQPPRPTALARLIRDLSLGCPADHPLLETPGWWHRSSRLLYQDTIPKTETVIVSRPLVIVGARGTLGNAFARLCESRGIYSRSLTRNDIDITDPDAVETLFAELRPWAVVNAAGYVRVDDAERESDLCYKINTEGAETLAIACERHGAKFVTFSSDLVFDGENRTPYREIDPVAPMNVYGRSKALAEERVLLARENALVVRTSAFFGPWDEYNFVTIALRHLEAGESFTAAEDIIVSPTYVPDLVQTTLDLLVDSERGVWHLANRGAIDWAELVRIAAKDAGIRLDRLIARPGRELGWIAPRPVYSVLGSDRGDLLPGLDSALSRYHEERRRL